jgi:hypothetical protein
MMRDIMRLARLCKNAAVVLYLVALVAPLRAMPLAVPEDIQQAVHRVQDAWREKRVEDAQQMGGVVTNQIHGWIAESLRTHGIGAIIEALKLILPVAVDPVQPHWKYDNPWHEPKDPISLNAVTWRAGQREFVVVWVDRVFRSSPKSNSYVQGTPPVALAKEGREVRSSGPLLGWRADFEAPPLYMVHGFIEGPMRESWPDVLISCGPVGQQLAFHIAQLHLVTEPKHDWRFVWTQDLPLVEEIDFDVRSQELTLEAGYDRKLTETQVGAFRLIYGAPAILTKRFHQK